MADDKKYVVPREKRLEDINKEIDTAKEASKTAADSIKRAQTIYDRATDQEVLNSNDISDIARRLKPVVDNLDSAKKASKELPVQEADHKPKE